MCLQCDDSLSSGSLGGRSLSPTRSDESSDTPRRPLMVKVLPSRPVRKRRLAPKPPLAVNIKSNSNCIGT